MARLQVVIDVPPAVGDVERELWAGALGWPLGTPWPGHPELRSFTPPDGDAYVHLQVVDAPASVHVDVESRSATGGPPCGRPLPRG